VLLAGAVALRLAGWHEAPRPNGGVVRDAWALTHGAGLGRHGGFTYLLVPVEWRFGSPSYDAARILVLVLAVAGVAAAWWLGRAAYGVAAAFVAAAAVAVDTAHVAASREAVAAIPLAALAAVALALLCGGRIELAGAAAGLAAAVDWPGWLLLVPLVVVAWGLWRRLAVAAALALVLSAPAWLDLHALAGHRELPHLLWRSLGPVLALAAAGLVAAVAVRTRADRALVSFALADGLFLLAVPAQGRSTLPLAVALGALAGRFRSLVPVALLLLVIPLTWSIRDARELRRHAASTMVRGETGSAHRAPGGARAVRLGLLQRREDRAGGGAGEAALRAPRRLAEAGEPDQGPGLLPGLAAGSADVADRRALEQHRRRRSRP
jgi:hypothetical protein